MSLLRNGLLIVLIGTAVGLVANALSPRGLSLTRDYFGALAPAEVRRSHGAVPPPASHAGATVPGADGGAPSTTAKDPAHGAAAPADSNPSGGTATTKHGLPLATHDEVVGWFHDPAYREQRIVFIDARNDDAYATGHIPGAYPFDHYHPENHMANVLAVTQLAERIVVYCTGGDCEDSELAMLDLIALGIPRSKLVIYGGGFTEWTKRHLPVQTGPAHNP